MRSKTILAITLLAGSTACDLLTGPGGGVEAYDDPPNVVVVNDGDRPVYYFAIEQGTAALTLWGACDDPDTCDAVAPRERLEIPYASVTGYTAAAEVVLVYWWHLVPKSGGGYQPDEIRVLEVPL